MTHAEGIDPKNRERGLQQASFLLDRHGEVPDVETLGRRAVERRVEAYTVDDEVEPYWDDEKQTLQTLIEAHGDRG